MLESRFNKTMHHPKRHVEYISICVEERRRGRSARPPVVDLYRVALLQ